MGSIKLGRFQRIGLLIAAILVAWLLWEQVDDNGLDGTSWLPPILAIITILLVATHGIDLQKSATAVDPRAASIGSSQSDLRISPKGWKLIFLIAAVAIPVVGIVALSLFGEKAADEATTEAYESAADDAMGASAEALPMSDANIAARANELSRRLDIPAAAIERNIREMEAREGHGVMPDDLVSPTDSGFFAQKIDRYALRLPKNWRWLDRPDAAALDAKANALTSAQGFGANAGTNDVLIAGNALDDTKRSIATIRLSVRPGKAASQVEMRQALQEPQSSIAREIFAEAEKTASAMRRRPTTSYYRVIGGAFRQNASVVCLWTGFEFDVGKGPTVSDTWICPLGDRTLKLSTSYSKAYAARLATTIDHTWRSLEAR